MKIFSFLQIGLATQSAAAISNSFNRNEIAHIGKINLNRAARYAEKIEHNDLALMRLMEDVSTFYELFLSGALTRDAVNAHLRKRDSHFIELNQRQYDMLIDKWLYQMIGF